MFDMLSDQELAQRAREARQAAREIPPSAVEHQEAMAYAEALEAELYQRQSVAVG